MSAYFRLAARAALVGLLFWALPAPLSAQSLELAGVRLLGNADDFKERIELGVLEQQLHQPYLALAALKPVPGVRGGYVTLGKCQAVGKILRIKVDYQDSSSAFFDTLLKELSKRHGEPQHWRGNAFGNLKTWKWTLKDAQGNKLSLILQHYDGADGAFTPGNSLRLSCAAALTAEQLCSSRKSASKSAAGSQAEAKIVPAQPLDLDFLLPR